MKIIEAVDKDEYDNFILQSNGNFQQSWEWMDLQERMNRKTARLLVKDEAGKPRRAASFVRHDLPLNQYYWIAPRGPVFEAGEFQEMNFDYLKAKLGGIFLRVEPEVEKNKLNPNAHNLTPAPDDHSPRATVLLDLEKSEEALLMAMQQKTRYNVRLSRRKGVQVKTSNAELIINDFLDLLEETAERDEFSLHPRQYYEEMLKVPFVRLFTAHHKDRLVAGAIVSFFGDRAIYLHGASSYQHRRVMAPHLLHWEIIRAAKQDDRGYYDLGGVMPKGAGPEHPWKGMTRFKKGFGGEYVEYVGTLDYVLRPVWYTIYKAARLSRQT